MSSGETDRSTVRLRALSGTPLADHRVRETVIATAHAIAERCGVLLDSVHADDTSITVTIRAHKLAALGLLAELRRITTTWYERKYHTGPLWGELPPAMNEDWSPDSDAPF